MPQNFPYGVVIILGCGLVFTAYVIYYILKLAYEEMKDGEMDTQGGEISTRQKDH